MKVHRLSCLSWLALFLLGGALCMPLSCVPFSGDTGTPPEPTGEKNPEVSVQTSSSGMTVKDHHRDAGLSCQDCHESQPGTAGTQVCLSCHGTFDDVARSTAAMEPNPHDSVHYGPEVDCDLCHHEHRASENMCNSCHTFQMTVP